MSGFSSKLPALLALTLMGAVLSGCGRHGPLEAPPGSSSAMKLPSSESEENRDPTSMTLPSVDGQESKKDSKKVERPKRPFVLDPIL